MAILLALCTFVLLLVSLFMGFMVLLQRANTNAGMGSAFGGGVTESAFGADTGNVLTRATVVAATLFFVLTFGLYLGRLHQHSEKQALDRDKGSAPVLKVDTSAMTRVPDATATPVAPAAPAVPAAPVAPASPAVPATPVAPVVPAVPAVPVAPATPAPAAP